MVTRQGHREEMTEVSALMKRRAETSGLVLLEAQTGSVQVIAKYIKDGHRTLSTWIALLGALFLSRGISKCLLKYSVTTWL